MNNFKKYRYLGNTVPEVSEPWKPTILEMIEKIDAEVRPWYIPLWFLNMIADDLKELIIGDVNIISIKTKFASLRIQGTFDDVCSGFVRQAISKCSITCEKCGSNRDVKECVQHNWVINLCSNCKNNNGNNRNNSSNEKR